jgi:flagellar M-ring protein FliF
MPVEFKNLFMFIKNKWMSMTQGQRTWVIISGSIVSLLLGGIIMWAVTPEYKPLFSNLSESESAAVIKKLEEEKIPFRIDKDGKGILVPEKYVLMQRIKIAGSGAPIGNGVGFELFDKMSFGMSEEERRINFQRALQTELERTIDNIAEVEKSRVHLTIPEQKLFNDEQSPAKASVYVKMAPGAVLSKQQISGIQNLVASSVDRLLPENVAIISTDGKILTEFSRNDENEISDKKLQLISRVEEYYRRKIQTFLDNIVGVNNSTVRVTASIEFSKIEKSRESYNPQKNPAVMSEDVLSEGINPTELDILTSNTATPPMPPVLKQKKSVNYKIDREIERTVITPGNVNKITVAVVINGKYDSTYLTDLKQSIAAATGIDIKKGDVIDIKAIEFKPTISEEEKKKMDELAKRNFYLSLMREYLPAVVLLILGILFATNMSKSILTLSKTMQVAKENKDNGNGNGHGKHLQPEDILKMAKENPKEAAKVIKSWIS